MTPDEFKKLVTEIGGLIDKRADTTEINIKAHVDKGIDDLEKHMHEDIAGSEERTTAEILVSRAEAKADNLQLRPLRPADEIYNAKSQKHG
jgi:hypothetical protein